MQHLKTLDSSFHVKRGTPQTSRKPGLSSQAVVYKDSAYNQLKREMDTAYGQVIFPRFLETYVKMGRNLFPSELKKLKTLQGLDKIKSRKDMYPIIVSATDIDSLFPVH